jgi:hypothetical protein
LRASRECRRAMQVGSPGTTTVQPRNAGATDLVRDTKVLVWPERAEGFALAMCGRRSATPEVRS